MYQKGWFYNLMFDTAMLYTYVRKGEHAELFTNLNIAKNIPSIFKYTVAEGTDDCDDNLTHDFDKVVTLNTHQKLNQTFGCTFPFWGGFYLDNGFDMCTNNSLYDRDILSKLLDGRCIFLYCKIPLTAFLILLLKQCSPSFKLKTL